MRSAGKQTDKALTELRRQGDASEADQRAWVKISASPRRIAFDPASQNARIDYGLRIENVGRSVALQARIEAKAVVFPHDNNVFDVLENTQEKFCADTIANKATVYMDKANEGITLFPGEHYPSDEGGFVGSTTLEANDIIGSEPYINGNSIGRLCLRLTWLAV